MRFQKHLLLFVLTFCVIGGGVLLFRAKSATRTNPLPIEDRQSFETPYHRLNAAARAARDGSADSIDRMAEVVVSDFVPLPLPSYSRQALQARLVRSELIYREHGKGILEINIVRTINQLADKLGTPRYTKTTPGQVRFLRASMIGVLPQFIGQETAAPNKKLHSSLKAEMSPIEAFFVTALLAQQKVLNEDFQLGAKDWQELTRKKATELWQSNHENRRLTTKANGPELNVLPRNPKSEEIKRAIQQSSSLNADNLANLVEQSLDVLGIHR